jgi:hypothetical protein
VPGRRTRRVVRAEVFQGAARHIVPITVARQRDGGWLVQAVDIEVLMPGGASQTSP